MTNTQLKKYLKNELSSLERKQFEQEIENDIFLKEGIEGLRTFFEINNDKNIDDLDLLLTTMIDNLTKNK